MKKILGGLIVGSFLFGGALVFALPSEIELKWEGMKFPPVKFNHAKHIDEYKVECKICHHADADPNKEVKKCIECHDIAQAQDKILKAMDAYHKTCIECHKKVNAEQAKQAPTKCNDCHKRS
ncbi:cytochrome c3 family protein [Thermodesulfobacterium sp. TA1]|uniref:cytochrome c3 family protein n=1 Tax=Thermodesulfobacterium sp. TA1 TaxID=2234087 RepID=UPI00123226E8|nr:cytochrome c3 family protein [Thermodesulfobacterium sp. TA1]QER42231.1 cytochrome c3 family protein [Thermodesulfobacterium sp. TA1]